MFRLSAPFIAPLLLLFSASLCLRQPKPEACGTGRFYLVFVLDKSGSMSGLNRTPSVVITPFLPKTVKRRAIFTSPPFLFNHENSTLHNREPISKVKNLTLDDYSVGG